MEFQNKNWASIDFLKAVGAQLIVLHHLAFYGPMSDIAYDLAPWLFDWLYGQARQAVQVFLVVGGFLAARSLAPRACPRIDRPMQLICKRFFRLAIPLWAALTLAITCAALARAIHPQPSLPAAPETLQLLAHLFLLQNLLGFEALSAGVWYVAIDFQLYVMMVALFWLFRHRAMAPIAALAAVSLFHFNRIPAWDDWGLYFFGAYALGALACWAGERTRPSAMLVLMAAVVALALFLDFRSRIVVALVTAVLLGLMTFRRTRMSPGPAHLLAPLGDISYAVFLMHYPICMIVNAAFGRLYATDPAANAFGMLLAWGLSLLTGALFHRHVEKPAAIWLGRNAMPTAAR